MDNSIRTWLYDIQSSIQEIESYFEEGERKFEIYQSDIRTKRAVERNIEIIGEAINRILRVDNSIQISKARKIVDTRNRIIHGYDSISDDMIWGIVVNHLPKLLDEVSTLIEK